MSGHTPIAYFDVAELKDGKLNSDVFVFRQPDIELFAAYHEDDYNAIRAQRDELLAALELVASMPGFEPDETYGSAVLSVIRKARSEP